MWGRDFYACGGRGCVRGRVIFVVEKVMSREIIRMRETDVCRRGL